MKIKQRALSLLLTIAMVLTFMPAMAFAGDGDNTNGEPKWLVSAYASDVIIDDEEARLEVVIDYSAYGEDEELPTLSYQWYRDDDEGGVLLEDETNSYCWVWSIGSYYCVVSDEEENSRQVMFNVRSNRYEFSEPDPNSAQTIQVNETKNIHLEADSECVTFKFTPSKSGSYVFQSASNDELVAGVDPIGRIMVGPDADGYYTEYDYYGSRDDFNNRDFGMTFEAKAGVTYYLQAMNYSKRDNIQFTVSLIENPWKSISFTPSKTYLYDLKTIKNIEERDSWTEEGVTYTQYYYVIPFDRGDRLTVTTTSGTTTYVYDVWYDGDEWVGGFKNGDARISGYVSKPWYSAEAAIGVGDYKFEVEYMGLTTTVPVKVVQDVEAYNKEQAEKAAAEKAAAEKAAAEKAAAEKAAAEKAAAEKAAAEKAAAEQAELAKTAAGTTHTVSNSKYKVLTNVSGANSGTVAFITAKNAKSVAVPETVKLNGKTFKVTQVNANAFKGKKIRTVTIGKNVKTIKRNAFKKSPATKIILKTKLLKKAKVKGCLKGSKIKTVQVKVGSKSQNKKTVKSYKKIFTKANAGKTVIVK